MSGGHPKYRADIDGLRAVAVLLVVGFHAFPGGVKGGFIGVDIFFVISGFLISTIIFEGLDQKSFSFLEFYGRRVRRIFPALCVVLLACLAFGWFTLLAAEYRQLGKHTVGGAGFFSNLLLASESGYFDTEAETKPLLHLWSLGIEEQFYIFWPLLLWVAAVKRFGLLAIIVLVAALSFSLNVWNIDAETTDTFYSPLTRIWELLLGATLAYLVLYRETAPQRVFAVSPELRSLAGAFLLGAGLFLIRDSSAFPGYWALLPTLGTALMISAGPQAWVNRVILSNPVLVWFGLISFPLYLWHWPLFSFLRIMDGEPTRVVRVVAVCTAIALAWLTYQWVEKPVRRSGNTSVITGSLVFCLMALGLSGYLVYLNNGFQGYGPRTADKIEFSEYFENSLPHWRYFEKTQLDQKYRDDCNFYDMRRFRAGNSTLVPVDAISPTCHQRSSTGRKVLFIWGDSHAQHFYHGLRESLPKDWDVLIVASSGCKPALVASDSKSNFCERSNWFARKSIAEQRPDAVLIAQSRNHPFEHLAGVGKNLKEAGVPQIIFTGPAPHWKIDLYKVVLKQLWNDTPARTFVGVDEKVMADNQSLKKAFASQRGLIFVDQMAAFCNEAGCLTRIGDDRKEGITSWDMGHLTPIASEYLAANFLANVVISAVESEAPSGLRAPEPAGQVWSSRGINTVSSY
jgi:peptidoglycan/LPS O-acetylase OafA/YrhL